MKVALVFVFSCVLINLTSCGLIQTDLQSGSDESTISDYGVASRSQLTRITPDSEQLSADLQSDSDESRNYRVAKTENRSVESLEPNSELTSDEFDEEMAPKKTSRKNKRRPKKSLSKKKVKRFARARYLEDKLKTLVEKNPTLKKRITDKLAERERKSLKKSKNVVSLVGPDGTEELAFNENQVDVYELPIYDIKVYEAPSIITETEAVAVETPSGEVILETLGAGPTFYPIEPASALENTVPCGDETDFDLESGRSKVYSRSIYDPINHELITFTNNPAYDMNESPESQIFSNEAVMPCTDLETLTGPNFQPLSLQSNEELVFGTDIVPVGYQPSPCLNTFGTSAMEGFEPRTFFSTIQDNLSIEPLNLSAEGKEELVNLKFKKNIASDQWPQELSNYLQLDSTFEMTPDYFIEQGEAADGSETTHYWAPLEPVKTYEIKQINIDEEAIIQEIKNVLGDVEGPIIIGEPGEPVIIKHFAKPYVIEYYERPIVVEHHQQAALNVYAQTPVVVDHYEPVVFSEIEAEPAVVVDEICPVIEEPAVVVVEEVCPVIEEIVIS